MASGAGGSNWSGELGDGTRIDHETAEPVVTATGQPLEGVTDVAAGYDHMCAILNSGEARCWGSNGFGQYGDGTRVSRTLPVPVVAP